MTYREALSQCAIAISASDSPDMPALGLSGQHLRDATTETARHLLALGARIVYGGDLRQNGFTELLFELVARHRRDADEGDGRAGVLNYLAWPVHIQMSVDDLLLRATELKGTAALVLLDNDGQVIPISEREKLAEERPTDDDWVQGLTAMRKTVLALTQAQIVLGGRVEHYKGRMPGIAEEALLALQSKQPLYLVGGFGGCARDIAEALKVTDAWLPFERHWTGRDEFAAFSINDLNNGLTAEENRVVAKTPHIDQAVTLILRGLLRLIREAGPTKQRNGA